MLCTLKKLGKKGSVNKRMLSPGKVYQLSQPLDNLFYPAEVVNMSVGKQMLIALGWAKRSICMYITKVYIVMLHTKFNTQPILGTRLCSNTMHDTTLGLNPHIIA